MRRILVPPPPRLPRASAAGARPRAAEGGAGPLSEFAQPAPKSAKSTKSQILRKLTKFLCQKVVVVPTFFCITILHPAFRAKSTPEGSANNLIGTVFSWGVDIDSSGSEKPTSGCALIVPRRARNAPARAPETCQNQQYRQIKQHKHWKQGQNGGTERFLHWIAGRND